MWKVAAMRYATLVVILAAVLVLGSVWAAAEGPARAADGVTQRRGGHGLIVPTPPGVGAPFAPSWRARTIWAADACWNDCQAYCSWGQTVCLKVDLQGRCLQATDRCDRVCQSGCRITGGPFVGFVE